MLEAAAALLGTNVGAPAAAADGGASAAPPRASLTLERAQYDALSLWFEADVAPQHDGYNVTAELKSLLFEALCDGGSTIDLQQLLLYACDTPSKGFAVLGFHTQRMLSLDGVYELLHRERAGGGLEPPEHLDPYSRAALARLFANLKLSTSERAPYSLVASNPHGADLVGSCESYVPKEPYALVAEITGAAGRSLAI